MKSVHEGNNIILQRFIFVLQQEKNKKKKNMAQSSFPARYNLHASGTMSSYRVNAAFPAAETFDNEEPLNACS